MKKKIYSFIFLTLGLAGIVWAAQTAVTSNETPNEAWTIETNNNSDLQTNIDGKQDVSAYLTDIAALTPVANNLLGWNSGATDIENKATISISWGRYSAYEGTTADDYEYRWDAGDPTVDHTFPIAATATKDIGWTITDTGVATAVANGLQGFVVPSSWVGMNITSIIAVVDTAGVTGTTDIQLRRVRAGTPVDVLSTVATIDTTELTTETAATPYVINTSNDDLALGDKLFPDIDAISTTPAEGLSITIEAEWPEG